MPPARAAGSEGQADMTHALPRAGASYRRAGFRKRSWSPSVGTVVAADPVNVLGFRSS
jgi:hypothetical protein